MDKRIGTNIYTLKGIGAILIIIYHYSVYYGYGYGEFTLKYFNFAYLSFPIPMFFIFSAFFLYKKAAAFRDPVKLAVYRMTRLYPMYWIAVLFSSAVICLAGEPISAGKVLLNLTMVEKLFGVDHIDGAYWTMFYEIMLLVILAAASLIPVKKQKLVSQPVLLCACWLALGAAASAFMKLRHIDNSSVAVLLFACRYAPVFVMGIIFYLRYAAPEKLSARTFAVFYAASVAYELVLGQNIYHGIYGILSILICHMAFSGRLTRFRLFSWKPLADLGRISYCIYLTHNQFGRMLIARSAQVSQSPVWAGFAMVVIGIAAIVIASQFSKLEKLIFGVLKKWTARFQEG